MGTGDATKNIGQLSNLNIDRRAMDNYLLLYKYIFASRPRPKYIFNEWGTNIYYFSLQRFGPSPSPNLNLFYCIL